MKQVHKCALIHKDFTIPPQYLCATCYDTTGKQVWHPMDMHPASKNCNVSQQTKPKPSWDKWASKHEFDIQAD